MTEPEDRRKERRYIVVGIEASIGGVIQPILDISRSAVRLLKSPTPPPVDQPVELLLRIKGRRQRECHQYKVDGRLIRETHIDIVFGYEPPTHRWEATLRAHDTFQQTLLVEI